MSEEQADLVAAWTDPEQRAQFEAHVRREVDKRDDFRPGTIDSLLRRHPASEHHYENTRTQTRWEGWLAHALYGPPLSPSAQAQAREACVLVCRRAAEEYARVGCIFADRLGPIVANAVMCGKRLLSTEPASPAAPDASKE